MCNLKKGTLRSLKIIGGHMAPLPPTPVPTALHYIHIHRRDYYYYAICSAVLLS